MDSDEFGETQLIHEWILSYTCYMALVNYSRSGDIGFNRDFVQGVMMSIKEHNSKTSLEMEILVLLCRLVDGVDHTYQYQGVEDDITPLEDAFHRFVNFSQEWNDYVAEPERALLVIMRQAVITCCREDDFQCGLAVLTRLEDNFKSKAEKELSLQLKEVIDKKDKEHQMIKEHPYSELHETVCVCLGPLRHNLETPFLIRATRMILSKKPEEQYKPHNNREAIHTELIIQPPLSDFLDDDTQEGFYLKGQKANQFSSKRDHLRHNKEELFTRVPEMLRKPVNCSRDNSELQKENLTDSSSSKSSSEELGLNKRLGFRPSRNTKPRKSLMPSNQHSQSFRTAQKLQWTAHEEAALYKAVQKCGVGNWADVVRVAKFVGRTNVHIKDKWRTLMKPKFRWRLKELRDLYGPIPNVTY